MTRLVDAASGRRRAVDELRAISDHVLYEIEMFAATTNMIANHILDGIDGDYLKETTRNALLESFTIHVRALSDFLYAAPRDDDVSALDFFTSDEWALVEAEASKDAANERIFGIDIRYRNFRSNAALPAVVAARKRVNKEIAHLTYNRLKRNGAARLWPHAEIVEALSVDLHRFADQVDHDRVDKSFRPRALVSLMALAPAEATAYRLEPGVATASLPPRP